jgi:hypothetical protein
LQLLAGEGKMAKAKNWPMCKAKKKKKNNFDLKIHLSNGVSESAYKLLTLNEMSKSCHI